MPSKIALICDTHYGVRGDNPSLYTHFAKFYENVFFPTIDKYGIDHIIHLGDVVDRRKFINFLTTKQLQTQFIEPILKRNIKLDIMVGNHDTFYKNTNSINAIDALGLEQYSNIRYWTEPETVDVKGIPILYMPWICKDTQQASIEAINNTRAEILFGHLELNGFEMHRGTVCDSGMESNLLSRFDVVCSGHFHHKSSIGNIHYLGAPYEMVWSDFNDPRGFHIFDLETRELEFIPNPHRLFYKLFYDDVNVPTEEILNLDLGLYKQTYIKVVVKNKSSPSLFDTFIDNIERCEPIDIQVVEDHLNLDIEIEEDIVNEAEDTITILNKFVDSLNTKIEKGDIKKVMLELYNDALNTENV